MKLYAFGVLLVVGCGGAEITHKCLLPSGTEVKTDKIEACEQVPIPGEQGPQGVPGKDGSPGRDGIDGVNGVDGANGKDGSPGRDGTNGVDGKDGAAPVAVKSTITLSATRATPGLYTSPTPFIVDVPANISVPGTSSTQQGWISLRVDSTYLCYQRRNNPANSPVYEFKWSKSTPCDQSPYEGDASVVHVEIGLEMELILHSPQIPSTTTKVMQLSSVTWE